MLTCRYNVGMRGFFEAGHCGDVHVVDVFNMTHALVTELPVEETLPLTYDSVHWAEVCKALVPAILAICNRTLARGNRRLSEARIQNDNV